MTTYLGITIGPITKTLEMARKTRHLWAASYTFAYLMKKIAQAIYDRDVAAQYTQRQWLKPAMGTVAQDAIKAVGQRSQSALNGVGIFPDHLIISLKNANEETIIRKDIFKALDDYVDEVGAKLGIRGPAKNELGKHLRQYFQISWVCKDLPAGENPILKIGELINTIEMQTAFAEKIDGQLFKFFDQVNDAFLAKDAFGQRHDFASIPEIAMYDFLSDSNAKLRSGKTCEKWVTDQEIERKAKNESADNDDRFVTWVQEFTKEYEKESKVVFPTPFLAAHKYIAIVQADGDSISKLLKSLQPSQWGDFSNTLASFSQQAAKEVETFGGLPVYFGGDDALFFAPVVRKPKKGEAVGYPDNIFGFLAHLDKVFQALFQQQFPTLAAIPTLSFGLSITYYKYPLYEALKAANKQLYVMAKGGIKLSGTETGKNNIAFRVLKHSGSHFGGMIHLGTGQGVSVLEDFNNLMSMNVAAPSQAIRSLIYRIPDNKALLELIAREDEPLKNWISNSFDEDVHAQKETYIKDMRDLIKKVYVHADKYPADKDADSFGSADRIAYSLLKTIAFLTTKEN
jgi:CRISPR-associated protein Cmr2